jgi:hypothetical protein
MAGFGGGFGGGFGAGFGAGFGGGFGGGEIQRDIPAERVLGLSCEAA